MAISDPIADMLTRMRNSIMARHNSVMVPASRLKLSIIKILKEENFIGDYEVLKGKPHRLIKILLKYGEKNQPVLSGLERISKPGLRVYVQQNEIPRVYGGLGVAIISTAQGVMTGRQAKHRGIGGELLCYVW